jgi:glycosyltransferase involved in cell wall biosynthesis
MLDGLPRHGRPLRILFVPGPGDVHGTWAHWSQGRDDPSIPSIGYSQQVYEFAQRIGAQVTVLSEHPLPADAPHAPDAPVRFERHCPRGGRGLGYHRARVAEALGIVRRAAALRADVILCQRHLDHFWPLAIARALGIAVVVSLHNTFWPIHRAPSRKERLLGALNGLALRALCLGRSGDPVICVSEAIRAQLRRICGPGFDRASVQVPQYPESWRAAWTQRPEGRPVRRLLYVGRVEESKGVMLLLDAFTRLAEAHPGVTLHYLGGGGHLDALRAAVGRSPVADRIEIAGQVDGARVRAEMGRADILVCPTTTRFAEGLAKTPVEAVLCGVPSVVSSTVPCADLLGEAARVFPADDAGALRDTLDSLLRDPGALLRMNAATRRQRDRFLDRDLSLAARIAQAVLPAPVRTAPAVPDFAAQGLSRP